MQRNNFGPLAAMSLAALMITGCGDDSSSSGGAGADSSTGSSASEGMSTSEGGGGTTSEGGDGGGTSSSSSSSTDGVADSSSTSDRVTTETDGDPTTSGETTTTTTTDGDESSSSSSDGDPTTGDPTEGGNEICQAPGDPIPCDDGTDDLFNAIGLGCVGGPNNVIPIFNTVVASTDTTAWRIVTQYGTHIDPTDGLPTWRPREGSSMLMISTGQLPVPDADGVLIELGDNPDESDNPDASAMPAPMSPVNGSNGGAGGTPFINCDGFGDCSDSILTQWNLGQAEANDLMWFQFETPVPEGTFGYSFDFAYFSSEFPEYVDDIFNDMFIAWSNSESYTGNLCFVNDEPCTVTALWPTTYPLGSEQLVGTQFDNDDGEATGWFEAKGSAIPGELLQLTFAVFDMGDDVLDTSVLVDNFRWDCEGCTPSEVDPCIGIDPV